MAGSPLQGSKVRCYSQDPEAEEGPELVPFVVETIVLARLDDPEQQEAGEARRPCHDEDGGDDVARIASILTE